jgi:hypothetical protein
MTMTYLIGGIVFPLRLTAFLALEVAGAVVQFLFPGGGFVPGALLSIAGAALMLAKGFTTKPKDLGLEDWQPTGESEIVRIVDNIREARKAKRPAYAAPGIRVLVVFLAGLSFFFFCLESMSARSLWFAAVVAFFPYFFSGGFALWIPAELRMKLEAFRPFLESKVPEGLVLTPYLRLDKDAEGRRIPEDVRIMLEPKRKPADFEGAQFQVAINKGPNGPVPYLYAVFLCKGAGKSYATLERGRYPGCVVEGDDSGEYATVVVRQDTEDGGYHTKLEDCQRLYRLIVDGLRQL